MNYIFGIIILALDIWAVINVLGSSASGGAKIGWTLGIVIFPVLGFIVWFFAGPKSGRAIA